VRPPRGPLHPMKRRALAALLLALWAAGAAGDDAPKPPPAAQPPAGQPKGPPADPAKEQAFQDKAAEDALALLQKGDIGSVMDGIERLSKLQSGKVTSAVIDFVLARRERHVAQFAGFALSCADPKGALKEMSARLADPRTLKPDQLEQMACLLAEVPVEEADKLLASDRLLRSLDEGVRREAIRGLGWRRSSLGIESAIDALQSRESETRNVACVALGRIADKRASASLLAHLDEKDGGTGGFAAVALGRIEDESIFPEICARFGSGNPIDKGKALVAAARPRHVDKLLQMVRTGGQDVKIAACAALGKIKNQALDTQKVLLDTVLGDSDRWVRCAAFHALGMCATPELAPIVGKRLGQKEPEKFRYLYEIAADVGSKEVLPLIEDSMWGERNDVLRRIAIDCFWRMRDGPAIAACEDKIKKATGKNFDRAMEILGMRKNRNGFDLALDLLAAARPGSHEDYVIELALEKQTGHFFGPDVTTWKDWIAKNPKFFEKEQLAVERAKWREEFLKENSSNNVTPATEQSVQMALDYLARHQSPDGRFDQQSFLKLCSKKEPCPTASGARIDYEDIGTTSLCVLAYFGAGCGPTKGRYRGVLASAVEYLLTRQMANGDYFPNDLIGGYERPLALQAYAEASLAAVEDPQYLPFMQRGVDFLANIQADKGGWRYRVVDNANDTSVVAWVLFACKAAEKAHAKVRRSIYEGCDLVLWKDQTHPVAEKEDFVHDIDPNYAYDVSYGKPYYEFWTGYQDPVFEKNKACTALGLMSRILLGYRRSHPFCIGSANKVLTQMPAMLKKGETWQEWSPVPDYEFPMYFFYYATLSMHQMGGKYFSEWNKMLKEVLPGTQIKSEGCERGSWTSWGRPDMAFSRLYTTAMATLTLETYYRYAPVLQD
jgi:HEAT repeat protein